MDNLLKNLVLMLKKLIKFLKNIFVYNIIYLNNGLQH